MVNMELQLCVGGLYTGIPWNSSYVTSYHRDPLSVFLTGLRRIGHVILPMTSRVAF